MAAPPGVVTDAAFERGSLMWACMMGAVRCCRWVHERRTVRVASMTSTADRSARVTPRRPLLQHCPGHPLEHEGWEGPSRRVGSLR